MFGMSSIEALEVSGLIPAVRLAAESTGDEAEDDIYLPEFWESESE